MAKAQDVDMSVAADMLIAHVKNRIVDTPDKYDFSGQEYLNYTELNKEIAEMESAAAVFIQA